MEPLSQCKHWITSPTHNLQATAPDKLYPNFFSDTLNAAQVKPELEKRVELPDKFDICDIHNYSANDMKNSLIKLESLVMKELHIHDRK